MENNSWLYYEDVVEVIEDIFNYGGKIRAKKGHRVKVMTIQHEERAHVDVRFEGRSQWISIPTSTTPRLKPGACRSNPNKLS